MKVTPLSDAPIIPKATKYQGDCFPALKKSALLPPRLVRKEININTEKYARINNRIWVGCIVFYKRGASKLGSKNTKFDCANVGIFNTFVAHCKHMANLLIMRKLIINSLSVFILILVSFSGNSQEYRQMIDAGSYTVQEIINN